MMQALQGHDLAVLSINYFEGREWGKGQLAVPERLPAFIMPAR